MSSFSKFYTVLITCIIFILLLTIINVSYADSNYKVGTATTAVYVRDIDTGEIKGSLAYGDKIYVESVKNNWCIAKIGDKTYKIYADYISFDDEDDSNIRSSIRKQGNAKDKKVNADGIIEGSMSSHKIGSDSEFSDWDWIWDW